MLQALLSATLETPMLGCPISMDFHVGCEGKSRKVGGFLNGGKLDKEHYRQDAIILQLYQGFPGNLLIQANHYPL